MASDSLATSLTLELPSLDTGERASDAELIAAYREGNLAAFGELTRRYQIGLFRLMLGVLGDEDRAEEVCEDAFVAASRRLEELDDPTRFHRWLLGIARAISQEKFSAPAPSPPPRGPSPRERLKQEIRAVLQSLEPDHRLALILVEMRGAPFDEVAAALGVDLDGASTIVGDARAAFAAALQARERQAEPRPDAPDAAADGELAPEALAAGTLVAERYRILSRLGAGGMGAVYLAEKLEDGTKVALKTMLPGNEPSERAIRRFEREVEIIARLDSERIVKLLDHGQASGALRYLVMEYLDGRSLADCVHAQAPLVPGQALGFIADMLEGLQHAHASGVIHRDLKPDNVMLVDDARGEERAKLLDLGLAKVLDEDSEASEARSRVTRQGAVFGTPAYMAPEQAMGKPLDARADLYAITVILFELLTSRLPFRARNASALLVKHVSEPPPSLARYAPHLEGYEALEQLVAQGLAKQPEDRIPDAASYLARVEALVADGQLSDSIPFTMELPGIEAGDGDGDGSLPLHTSTPAPEPAAPLVVKLHRRLPSALVWLLLVLLGLALLALLDLP